MIGRIAASLASTAVHSAAQMGGWMYAERKIAERRYHKSRQPSGNRKERQRQKEIDQLEAMYEIGDKPSHTELRSWR